MYHPSSAKVHSSVLSIDLAAIKHNLDYFRSKLAPATKLMAMVKAWAYGSGYVEVSHLLQHCQVDYLAVAYADEGVVLRERGITLPIMVTNPIPTTFATLTKYQLEPVLHSLSLVKALAEFASAQNQPISVHLKLETGMHRLGFPKIDLAMLVRLLQKNSLLQVKSIYSHLAAAITPQHDAYTQAQVALFQQLALDLEKKLNTQTIKHILNTAGILRFPTYQFDMVRLGRGLYGIGINEGMQHSLQLASTLKTVILQIKSLSPGATIGYDRKGIAQRPMKIATLAIGYADGLNRALGNGKGKVWIHGQLAPVVGDICMDMTMVDVTDIDTQEGDEVVIFGREFPINNVAEMVGTIPQELLVNVSERVRRIYTGSELISGLHKEMSACMYN